MINYITNISIEVLKVALRDHAKDILNAIAIDLTESQTEWAEKQKSQGYHDLMDAKGNASTKHGKECLAPGFGLNATVVEYRVLRATVIQLWQKSLLNTAISETEIVDLIRFNEAIDHSMRNHLHALKKSANAHARLKLVVFH